MNFEFDYSATVDDLPKEKEEAQVKTELDQNQEQEPQGDQELDQEEIAAKIEETKFPGMPTINDFENLN